MATEFEELQQLYHRHQDEHGGLPDTTYNVVKWAAQRGLLVIPKIDPFAVVAKTMSKALREEYRTDSKGRRYRVNHSARIDVHGVQLQMWAELERAPRPHMEAAFKQRRQGVVHDLLQLQTDVDVYNDLHADHQPIQMVLDFRDDIAEIRAAEDDGLGDGQLRH